MTGLNVKILKSYGAASGSQFFMGGPQKASLHPLDLTRGGGPAARDCPYFNSWERAWPEVPLYVV